MDKTTDKSNIEIDKTEIYPKHVVLDIIKRILCLVLPVAFAFLGYFLAPHLWALLNKAGNAPEYFKFISSLVFFFMPTILFFIETRKLNPIIKITIKDKED